MSEEKTQNTPQPEGASAEAATPASEKAGAAKAAAKPKKEKPPAPEDKPFPEFMTQEFIPALEKTLKTAGIDDIKLAFEKKPLPIKGTAELGECWQVHGSLKGGQRQFIIGFLKEDIAGQKFFSYADNGAHFSTLESFMIDERKVTLDLMVLYTLQRLNGQKWLGGN